MKARALILIMVLMLVFACKQSGAERSGNQVFQPSELGEFERKVLEDGDHEAYESLQTYYMDRPSEEFLKFARVMAEDYHYVKAYRDLFEIIVARDGCSYDYNLECLSEETRSTALVYFKKAVMMGDQVSSTILLEYYVENKTLPIKELYENEALVLKAKQNIAPKNEK